MEAATMELPVVDQRKAALKSANTMRVFRAALKGKVRRKEVDAATLLLDPPSELHNMRVLELVMATPRIGAQKANRILNRAGIAPTKRVGALTARQRSAIAEGLRPPTRASWTAPEPPKMDLGPAFQFVGERS